MKTYRPPNPPPPPQKKLHHPGRPYNHRQAWVHLKLLYKELPNVVVFSFSFLFFLDLQRLGGTTTMCWGLSVLGEEVGD